MFLILVVFAPAFPPAADSGSAVPAGNFALQPQEMWQEMWQEMFCDLVPARTDTADE